MHRTCRQPGYIKAETNRHHCQELHKRLLLCATLRHVWCRHKHPRTCGHSSRTMFKTPTDGARAYPDKTSESATNTLPYQAFFTTTTRAITAYDIQLCACVMLKPAPD